MKTILIILVCSFALFAQGALSANTVEGLYSTAIDEVITLDALDTMAAVDSYTVYTRFKPRRDQEYILNLAPFTGTGSDSVDLKIRVDAYDASNNLIGSIDCDSLTTASGYWSLMPFNRSIIGYRYTIKLLGITGAGTQLIVHGVRMYKRMPYSYNRSFQGVR